MLGRHAAALTALLVITVTSLASAQAAGDSGRTDSTRARARDERALTTDTMRLHREIAIRDSARAALERDQATQRAEGAKIDSLKAQLARDQKATPRNTAAINRDLAALKQARAQLDRDLDRNRAEKQRVEAIEKKVDKWQDAASEERHDIRQDHVKSSSHADTGTHRRG